jgi:hypothetical protein
LEWFRRLYRVKCHADGCILQSFWFHSGFVTDKALERG